MFALLVALFILVPIVEITVIVMVADWIGGWNAIALMILVSAVGAWLARHEGFVTWRRIQESLARGDIPGTELVDGFLILVAGLLMLTPGFVTDLLALTVLFPPTRALFRAVLRRRFDVRTIALGAGFPRPGGRPGGPDDVIDV
jgi:UPF0716 protein FxsA